MKSSEAPYKFQANVDAEPGNSTHEANNGCYFSFQNMTPAAFISQPGTERIPSDKTDKHLSSCMESKNNMQHCGNNSSNNVNQYYGATVSQQQNAVNDHSKYRAVSNADSRYFAAPAGVRGTSDDGSGVVGYGRVGARSGRAPYPWQRNNQQQMPSNSADFKTASHQLVSFRFQSTFMWGLNIQVIDVSY